MVDELVLYGKIFSTVEEAGVTAQNRIACLKMAQASQLRAEGINRRLRKLLSASCTLPRSCPPRRLRPRRPTSDIGTVMVAGLAPTSTRRPSKPANQKNLSLRNGPPAVAPNCSKFAGVTCPVK